MVRRFLLFIRIASRRLYTFLLTQAINVTCFCFVTQQWRFPSGNKQHTSYRFTCNQYLISIWPFFFNFHILSQSYATCAKTLCDSDINQQLPNFERSFLINHYKTKDSLKIRCTHHHYAMLAWKRHPSHHSSDVIIRKTSKVTFHKKFGLSNVEHCW